LIATVRARRPRIGILATAVALVLAATPAAFAQEEDETPTEPAVVCDAELVEEDGDEFYVVEPGETVDCTAVGLDDELDVDWEVAVYGITADDLLDLDLDLDLDIDLDEDAEPIVVFPGPDDAPIVSVDGEASFSFTIPADLVFGWFEGAVLQFGEAEAPVYEQYFEGLIFGDFPFFDGDMDCAPDPASKGGEVECIAQEMTPGGFEWAVFYIAAEDLFDLFFGDGELGEPDDGGEGDADAAGDGTFSFSVPATGDFDLYLAIAEQDEYLALYAGEVGPAVPTPEEPVDEEDDAGEPKPEVEQKPAVTVPRPTRVDAGAGGTAPSGSAPLAAITLGLALTAALTVRRFASRDR
jgi:hypothetical protein